MKTDVACSGGLLWRLQLAWSVLQGAAVCLEVVGSQLAHDTQSGTREQVTRRVDGWGASQRGGGGGGGGSGP